MTIPLNGDKVTYIKTPDRNSEGYKKGSRGVCVSEPYMIQDWTFINVSFGSSPNWHPINVKNLSIESLTNRFDMLD